MSPARAAAAAAPRVLAAQLQSVGWRTNIPGFARLSRPTRLVAAVVMSALRNEAPDERAARKAAVKAAKEAKRLERQASEGA